MKDLVERAAIALYTHQAWAMGGYAVWQSVPATVKDAYRAWARDVLFACREATEAMVAAGFSSIPDETEPRDFAKAWSDAMSAGLAESDAINPPKVNGNAQRGAKHLS